MHSVAAGVLEEEENPGLGSVCGGAGPAREGGPQPLGRGPSTGVQLFMKLRQFMHFI